jgi:hypothetical protein
MKRPRRRAPPERPSTSPPDAPQDEQFEKPFVLLVFGVVAASVMCPGCVLNLIWPFRPSPRGRYCSWWRSRR